MNLNLTSVFLLSSLITLISIIILLPIARKFNLVDIPSKRKSHLGSVPLIGGLSILMGVYVSTFGSLVDNDIFLTYMVSAFFILILGLIDDFYPLSPKIRLIIQAVIILTALELTGLKFDTLGHSFGLKTQINLGFFAYPVTVFGMLLVTNAFNLMDGADGVTGILAILAFSVIFLIEILSLNVSINPLTLALIGGLIPFLSFNMIKSKNKIFLGDSGSLFLGYTIAFLLLYETQINHNISPPLAFWIVAIPIFDAIAVMFIRLKNNKPLFSPDRNHLHYFLQDLGIRSLKIVSLIFGFAISLLLLGMFLEKKYLSISFYIFLIFLLAYILLRLFVNTKNFKI